MNETEPTYTISAMVRDGIPVNGKVRSYEYLNKLVREFEIKPEGTSMKGKPEFRIATMEKFMTQYEQLDEAGDEMGTLRKRKLEMEIAQLDKDIQKKDLQIEQLRDTLIDSEDVANFLVARRAVELAVLRRIFLVQMPIEVPGLSIPKAREKAQYYYNELVETYSKAEEIWKEKYDLDNTVELEKTLAKLITKVESSPITGSQAKQQEATTTDSGSANCPVA